MQDNDFFSLNTRASMSGESWRVLKIMSETVEGFETLAPFHNCVSIFGSSRARPDSPAYNATRAVARLLARNGYGIITGGGPGLMEAGNRGACEGGGASIGLHIYLPNEQQVNEYVKTRVNFRYFFTRKLMFVKYAAAYVVMPGGIGTLDEFTDALVLSQTGRIAPLPIILYGSDFWGGLLDWIRGVMVREGYVAHGEMEALSLVDSPEEVLAHIQRHLPL
jgi:uncharacterized protein (TIGR00730 family)